MTRPAHVIHDTVFVDSNVFGIVDPETADSSVHDRPEFGATGLLDRCRNGLAFICATHLGKVAVTVEYWRSEPLLTDADAWEDIAEIGLAWDASEMEVWGEGDTIAGPVPGPGHYRLRVAARHRDEGEDRRDDDPLEAFRIQVWPGQGTDLVALKATSRIGAYWRSVAET